MSATSKSPGDSSSRLDGFAVKLGGCLAAFVVYLLLRTVYNNLVRSPLRNFPGPLLAKLSPAWLFVVSFTGKRAFIIDALHQRYGPVVRVGPNTLSFSTAAAARDIYLGIEDDPPATDGSADRDASSTSYASSALLKHRAKNAGGRSGRGTPVRTFPKAAVYDTSRPTVFGLRDEAEHRARLKRVGHCFAPALLPDLETVMRTEIARLLRVLDEQRGKKCDMHRLSRYYTLDVSGQLFLGKSFGALTGAEPPLFLRYIDTAVLSWMLKGTRPLIFSLLERLPIKSLREFLASGDGVYELGAAAVNEFIARHGRRAARRLPLTRLLAGNTEQGVPPLPDALIADEMTIMLFAGTDTSASVLTYLLFQLARHPQWYARVRAEVCAAAAAAAAAVATSAHATSAPAPTSASRQLADGSADIGQAHERADAASADDADKPTTAAAEGPEAAPLDELQPPQLQQLPPFAQLNALPVLHAVLWETLRCHPPVLGSLARVVPRGGANVAGSTWLPDGTNVSVQVYTLQRNAGAFPQPHVWRPARWLARVSAPAVPLTAAFPTPGARDATVDDTRGCGDDIDVRVGGGGGAGDEAMTTYENEAMREHMLVFSRGARACLGKAIALMELKLVAAAIAQRFATLRVAEAGRTADDMRMTDQMLLVPKGHRCELVFGE